MLPPQRRRWLGRAPSRPPALRYGEDRVWQDVDDLTVGSDYLPQILKNIAAADAVLIVIGPHWLDARTEDGKTRLAGDTAGFESNLEFAEKCFEVVQREAELQLANAYTGSASIPMLRGDGPKALDLINHALELAPDHRYAIHDREEIRRFFKI